MAVGTSRPKDDNTAAKKADDKPKPTPPKRHVLVDSAEAHIDRVAMVSRDKNGDPDQGKDYELLVTDDASDEERRIAENRPEDNQIDTGESKDS